MKFKNCFCLSILYAVFFHRYTSYDMVPYQSCYPKIMTYWQLGRLKWLQKTQRTTSWRFCDGPDSHWWRSCDDPSDDLKMTLTTQKMTGDYLVTTLLMNWWWHLKISWQNLMTFIAKSKVAYLAGVVPSLILHAYLIHMIGSIVHLIHGLRIKV